MSSCERLSSGCGQFGEFLGGEGGTRILSTRAPLLPRQVGQKKVITATPRQLESLIRLAESLARMRFSQVRYVASQMHAIADLGCFVVAAIFCPWLMTHS